MVWEFKRQLYATETNVALERVAPLSDPSIQGSLQRYFDSKSGYPHRDDDSEYGFYFAHAYPSSHDRRLYIAEVLREKRPGYGYACLATLLAAGKVRQVWTTNFDDLLDRAFSIVAEGKSASVVGLDTAARLEKYLRDERYPIIVKLHGDFRYDDIKNVAAEVAEIDSELREALVEASKHYGLFIVGYSGRDTSVMGAIQDAIRRHGNEAFKEGLFWSVRESDQLGIQARTVLDEAVKSNIPTTIVRVPDFDDVATALYRVSGVSSRLVEEQLAARKDTRLGFPLYKGAKRDPVLKMNAVPIVSYPDTCYRFRSDIKGWRDLRAVIDRSQIVAALYKGSVLALGTQSDIKRVFGPRGVEDLRPTPLSIDDLRIPDSVVIGMFYQAIVVALTANELLATVGTRSRILYFHDLKKIDEKTQTAYTALRLPSGKQLIRKAHAYWVHEAAEISLDFREDRLWLLVRPTVILTTDGRSTIWESEEKKEVIRELLATRYNQPVSALLNFWLGVLFDRTHNGRLLYPPDSESGFAFQLVRTLGFSYHQA
jgi:hypothetical protein